MSNLKRFRNLNILMKDATIQKLKDYFKQRDDVSMAFLFGSQAKDTTHIGSDADIAVYFTPSSRYVDWEEAIEYPEETNIGNDVEHIIGLPTDLVVLNRAQSVFASEIVATGIPLVIKDDNIHWRFSRMVEDATEDMRIISKDWSDIRARSESLSEKDKIKLRRVNDFIELNLKDFNKYKKVDQFTYDRTDSIRRELERWVETLAMALIDVAKIILASEKKIVMEESYVDMARQLGLAMRFEKKDMDMLGNFAKLRNLLAHEYPDLRYAKIKVFLDDAEPIYRNILTFSKDYIANQKNND